MSLCIYSIDRTILELWVNIHTDLLKFDPLININMILNENICNKNTSTDEYKYDQLKENICYMINYKKKLS